MSRELVLVSRPDEVVRMLGQMRGWITASPEISQENRDYLLPKIDSCLEAFEEGLADEVRVAINREYWRLMEERGE